MPRFGRGYRYQVVSNELVRKPAVANLSLLFTIPLAFVMRGFDLLIIGFEDYDAIDHGCTSSSAAAFRVESDHRRRVVDLASIQMQTNLRKEFDTSCCAH